MRQIKSNGDKCLVYFQLEKQNHACFGEFHDVLVQFVRFLLVSFLEMCFYYLLSLLGRTGRVLYVAFCSSVLLSLFLLLLPCELSNSICFVQVVIAYTDHYPSTLCH